MGEVSGRLAIVEGLHPTFAETVPDTVPIEFVEGYRSDVLAG